MKKLTAIFCMLFSFLAFSEETLDVRFLLTQRTAANPYALPIAIGPNGEMSILSGNMESAFIFRPTFQADYSQSKINYSYPVILNRFNFYPKQKELGWVEVRRRRIEAGLGLSMIMREMVTFGLIPYKGALQTVIRHIKNQKDKSLPLQMPDDLSLLQDWNINDMGTYQTYGGLNFYIGASNGLIDFATGSIGIQNQFIVEIKKTSENLVSLTLTEEKLNRRQILVGAALIEGTYAQFKGKRLTAEFIFDLNLPEHHDLFKEVLKGNIKLLQERLDNKFQNLSWKGSDRSFYYGIPTFFGKVRNAGHYDLLEDGQETELNFTGSHTRGILTPIRNHQDLVYQTDEAIAVLWTSEMSSMSKLAFKKRFLSIGKTIGIKGFNRELPEGKFGAVVSQIAAHFSRKEIEKISQADLDKIANHLKIRCEEQKLSCRKTSRLKSIMKILTELKTKKWDEMRGDLGLLFTKEPALIHAVVKTMKLKKEVYFKFLSEKYQSLEGSSPVEI